MLTLAWASNALSTVHTALAGAAGLVILPCSGSASAPLPFRLLNVGFTLCEVQADNLLLASVGHCFLTVCLSAISSHIDAMQDKQQALLHPVTMQTESKPSEAWIAIVDLVSNLRASS